MTPSDAVFLLPGFLGFERTGNFSQFADRVSSALRGTLEHRLGRAVPVVPIAQLPARSLAARQRALLEALAEGVAALGGAERIHLVGYSLGGVDAYLLSCQKPLEAQRWPDTCSARAEDARARIASVISIASPHFGMCMAGAKGAGTLTAKRVLHDRDGAKALAQLVPKLVSSAWSKLDKHDLWHSAAREGRKIAHFAAELGRFQALLPALAPAEMEELHASVEPIPGIRRASVVALTAPLHEGSDPMFAEFCRYAAGVNNLSFGSHNPVLSAARQAIREALEDPERTIRSERAERPSLVDVTTNDGVVNTCRQLMTPEDPNGLLAVAVGDHFDLIGYYDRTDGHLGKERELVTGFLRSGSFFRDDQFFALYRKIGDCIADAALALAPAAEPLVLQAVPSTADAASALKPKASRARAPKQTAAQ